MSEPEAQETDEVIVKLVELGVDSETAAKFKTELGVDRVDQLGLITEKDLSNIGLAPIPARELLGKLKPTIDPHAELGEDEQPSRDQVTGFAGALGIDSTTMLLLANGGGGELDISSMVPIATLVEGYNPKIRNMFLMMMGRLEERLGAPIVVINADGAINRPLTVEYIEGLEEGRDAAESNIYFDLEGHPHEVVKVGVDAQSIYDADPLNSSAALQKNGMGLGRVQWNKVPLEVRQVVYLAVIKTGEIDPTNEAHLTWLRDHVNENANRLSFHGQAPRAITEYNEAARTGSLPTLRVMLSRSPRQRELMPRRRRSAPGEVSRIADIPG